MPLDNDQWSDLRPVEQNHIDDVSVFLQENHPNAYTCPEVVGQFSSMVVPTVDGSVSPESITAADTGERITQGAQMMAKIEHYRLILEYLVREGEAEKAMHDEVQGKEPYYRANLTR